MMLLLGRNAISVSVEVAAPTEAERAREWADWATDGWLLIVEYAEVEDRGAPIGLRVLLSLDATLPLASALSNSEPQACCTVDGVTLAMTAELCTLPRTALAGRINAWCDAVRPRGVVLVAAEMTVGACVSREV